MSAPTDFYRIRFSADPVQLMFFRGGLDRWLQGLRWPAPDRIDALLAVHEACANSVEHAYPIGAPGDVEVVGRLVVGPEDRRIVVVVRDHGLWRPVAEGRGLGLTTVYGCMDRVRIRHDRSGTVVTMTSRPVPLNGADESAPAARGVPEPRRGPAGARRGP